VIGQIQREVPRGSPVVVALVGGEGEQVACVPQGDLRADIRDVGPLRAAMDIDHPALHSIDEKRRLDGPFRPVKALELMTRCLSAVEVGGIDGGVSALVEQLR